MDVLHEPKNVEKSFCHDQDFLLIVGNELKTCLCLSDVRVNYTILTPKCYEYQHRSNWSFKKLCIYMRRDQRNGTGEQQVSKRKSKKGHNTGNKMGLHFHTC